MTAVLVDNPDGTQFGGGSLVVSVAGATADDNLVIVQTGWFITVSVTRSSVRCAVCEIVSDGSAGSACRSTC
jgi:hypothetical protein